MKPLVSILTPAYNAEPWIADTISSALRQSWPRKEIIVVDDGSTDHTLSVASKFSKDGVTVVSQKSSGASAARNRAYSLCRGDYIQWLDADDLLAPDKIARQIEFAETVKNPYKLLSSEWGRFLYRTKSASFIPTPLWNDLSPLEWLVRKMTLNVWMQPGSWLVSRELTDAAGPWDERLSFDDDGEYFCRVLLKSQGVSFVKGARAYYRDSGPGSLSSVDYSSKKLESAWTSIQLHIKYLLGLEDSPRTRNAAVSFLQTWHYIFDPYRVDIIAEMQHQARMLGGAVDCFPLIEALRWKFAWMESIFGRRFAYWAQRRLPHFKHFVIRRWDKTLFQLGY
ncbi:MAG TPA: glycosyltransferase family A protein [Verrucomicrobiae bacterium]|nr:glycosyltransferase family A protein [Verrucomicrobiae bacterium]